MDGPYPNLRLWESGAAVREVARLLAVGPAPVPALAPPPETANDLYTREALSPPPARSEVLEPFTLQWYLEVERRRYGRRGRWLPKLLEFTKHSGDTLLSLGDGLGTDSVQYARHGACVVVCGPATAQVNLVRRNFELRGLPGRFLHASPTALPLESASIDVACIAGTLESAADPAAVVDEVYRVLKPGGKILAVVPARYDIDFWYRACFFLQAWLCGRPREGRRGGFSGRTLRRLLGRFTEHRVYKRQLRRADVPHLWRWIPLPLLERMMGCALLIKAFKPLSAAIPPHAATAA